MYVVEAIGGVCFAFFDAEIDYSFFGFFVTLMSSSGLHFIDLYVISVYLSMPISMLIYKRCAVWIYMPYNSVFSVGEVSEQGASVDTSESHHRTVTQPISAAYRQQIQ